MIDETMKTLTEELISRGTSYDIDFLKRVYADDLKFVRILPDNTVQILSKQDNIDFFQALKDSGAAPLNTAHTILFADSDGDCAQTQDESGLAGAGFSIHYHLEKARQTLADCSRNCGGTERVNSVRLKSRLR